jgi:hypothetical protein
MRWLDPQYDADTKEYAVSETVIDEIENLIDTL